MYPIDQVSNIPVRNIVAELTREAIFLRAHDEVCNIYILKFIYVSFYYIFLCLPSPSLAGH